MTEAKIIGYIVRNRVTGSAYGYKTSEGASRAMDRADNAYGAICTTRVAVWSDNKELVQEFAKVRI